MPDDPLVLFHVCPVGLWPVAAALTLLADLFHLDPAASLRALAGLIESTVQPSTPPHVCGLYVLPEIAAYFCALVIIPAIFFVMIVLASVLLQKDARPT